MHTNKLIVLWPATLLMIMVLAAGCAKRYVVTHDLEVPLSTPPVCFVGEIRDELPEDLDPAKKPALENINQFKLYLVDALITKGVFEGAEMNDSLAANYEVTGAILHYKGGSGFLRFLFGAMAGSAEVTTTLELRDRQLNRLVFAGNFTGTVTDWAQKGDQMFKIVADDFANALKKRNKKLLEKK
jgi:hypothetical protein